MHHQFVWIAIVAVLVVGPVALASARLFRPKGRADEAHGDNDLRAGGRWPLIINSTMAYALAFNAIFFLQELFLVLPKAMTPGLRPTLFHNNHTWSGENPVAALWQGTGAVATIVAGLICLATLPSLRRQSTAVRLFVIWLAYHGLIMGLAQVPVGALSPRSDLGMAMNYLGWTEATKTALALLALVLIVFVALRLLRCLLELGTADDVSERSLRIRFVFKAATIPAFFGTLLVIPFRVPREILEVVGPPLVVALLGIPWMQAGAWLPRRVSNTSEPMRTLAWPIIAALLFVFTLFHAVLARGVQFF